MAHGVYKNTVTAEHAMLEVPTHFPYKIYQ